MTATPWFKALEEQRLALLAQSALKGKEKTARYAAFRAAVLRAAKDNCAGSGKWLVHVDPKDADAVWAYIAESTVSGLLGSTSKVAPCKGSSKPVLICVYCERFWDVEDCLRVMDQMLEGAKGRELALKAWVVGFKPDVFTHLGISGDFGGSGFRKTLTKSDASDPTEAQEKWEAGKIRWAEVRGEKPTESGEADKKRKRGGDEADAGGVSRAGLAGKAAGSGDGLCR